MGGGIYSTGLVEGAANQLRIGCRNTLPNTNYERSCLTKSLPRDIGS